ncbi:MAG: hypothetical protein ACFE89_05330 [Candidatus Hodarchaeota archaeon]
MTEEPTQLPITPEPTPKPPLPAKPVEPTEEINEVIIRSYSKIVLFYPMAIISLFVAVFLYITGILYAVVNPTFYQQIVNTVTFVWLIIFFFNLLLVTFDFGKNVVIAIISLIIIAILGTVLIYIVSGTVPWINPAILGLSMNLNVQVAFFIIFLIAIFIAWIRAQVYYFKVNPNEIIYKKGILGDVERYGTSNVMFHKEINDIFEFLILRSGQLTFTVPGRKTAIVLTTVPKINSIEHKLLYLLRRIEVDLD